MKRTLLASAFAALALAASAQTQEVLKVKGDGFRFLTKGLTTEGKVIPYSTIGAEHNYGIDAEFTIYDDAFNKVKSFSYPLKQFTYKRTPMTALVDITQKTLFEVDDDHLWEKDSTITTMEQFKNVVTQILAEGGDAAEDTNFFIDYKGDFAFHYSDNYWERYNGTEEIDGKNVPTIEQSYLYYNKEGKGIYSFRGIFAIELDLANANFQQEEGSTVEEYTKDEYIEGIEIENYDDSWASSYYTILSQNFFNNDDKFEFVVKSYKLTAAPEASTNFGYNSDDLQVRGLENGKLKVRKTVQDKYYEEVSKVVNEDGKDLLNLPGSDYVHRDDLYRLNGKSYICKFGSYYGDANDTNIIYVIDETGTGLTELARTKQVPAPKFFNLQGMQVDKNAKGIVIQKGGAKYLNK